MKRKGFSLLEIIFVIAIVSFLISVAVPKLSNTLEKSKLIKIKGDIALIKDGLNSFQNKNILLANNDTLDSLEDDNSLLFSKILTYPLLNKTTNPKGYWKKISNSEYEVFIDEQSKVKFFYDSLELNFDCNFDDVNCKKLTLDY